MFFVFFYLSLQAAFGSETLYFMTLKNKTDMTSAIEEQEVGWPDLLAVVIFTEWIL